MVATVAIAANTRACICELRALVLVIFVLEIILKLMEHFWAFWNSNWNLADFIITILCVVLEVLRYSSSVSLLLFYILHPLSRQLALIGLDISFLDVNYRVGAGK